MLEAFAAAADRVTTMASERGRAVKINLDGDRLQLSVSNPDAGEANDEIGMDYRGPALEIGLNGRYIRDACQAFVHAEAALHIADASSPARLSPKNDTDRAAQDHEIVIMPIRV